MLAAPNETNTPGVRSVPGGVGHGDSGVDGVDGGDGGDQCDGMMLYVWWWWWWCVLVGSPEMCGSLVPAAW